MSIVAPIAKPIPCRDDRSRRSSLGTIHRDAIPIFIFADVLEEVIAYSEFDQTVERGGFLLGGLHEDIGPYVEIRHFVPAPAATSHAASLTFTHETWRQLHQEVERQYAGEQIVGWQHTHPGLGVFLSGYDLFLHRHFFSQPWQNALVVDPRRQELGFFQWRRDEIVGCGFICVTGEGVEVSKSRSVEE